MATYIIRRLIVSIPVVLLITIFVFLMTDLAPGDAVDALIDPSNPPPVEQMQAMKEALGLNKPLPIRYAAWLAQLATGNAGYSTLSSRPVLEIIGQRFGNTLLLMSSSLLLALVVGTVLGVVSALKQYSALDYGLTILAFVGISVPSFFTGLLSIYVFGVVLHWFPAGGIESVNSSVPVFLDRLWHLVLPVAVLSSLDLAGFVRYTRSTMLDVVRMDYVTTARAKGLREQAIIGRHVLRNALIPLITVTGMRLPRLFGGSLILEVVFSFPGIGLLAIDSVRNRDFPVIMGITFISSLVVLTANLLTDIAYGVADPRIRLGAGRGHMTGSGTETRG